LKKLPVLKDLVFMEHLTQAQRDELRVATRKWLDKLYLQTKPNHCKNCKSLLNQEYIEEAHNQIGWIEHFFGLK